MNGQPCCQAKKDIAFQVPVELMLREWLADRWKGIMAVKPTGKHSAKDFTIWRPVKVEVKCDFKVEETGNLFLETWNCYRDQPSGLTATKADLWIYYLPSKLLVVWFGPRRMLKELEDRHEHRKLTRCGDNNSNGYIVPLHEILDMPFVQSQTGVQF